MRLRSLTRPSFYQSAIIVFSFFICSLSTYAQRVYTFQQGVNGYTGTVDQRVNNIQFAERNYSGEPSILIDGDNPNDLDYAVIRFEDIIGNGPGQIPLNSVVISADLEMFVDNGGNWALMYDLLVPFDGTGNGLAQPWSNDIDPVPDVHFDSRSIKDMVNFATALTKMNVKDSLQRWINGSRENLGWIIAPTGSDGVVFWASEHAFEPFIFHSPYLLVETPAGTFRFQDGVDGYDGCVDTWIEEQNAGNSYGRSNDVLADGGAGDGTWALTRFDNIIGTAPGQIPPNTQINSAKLGIFVWNPGNLTTLHDIKPGHPFNELSASEASTAGVVHTSLNSFGNPELNPSVFFDQSAVLDQIDAFAVGSIELNVTSSIQRYANGEENSGWFFYHEGSFGGPDDGVEWTSSEFGAGGAPKLVIQTASREYTFQNNVNGYNGQLDTTINSGNYFDSSLVGRAQFWSDGDDQGGENFGLFRFDGIVGNGPNQVPPNTQIQSAKVILSIQDEGGQDLVYELLPDGAFDTFASWDSWGDPLALDSPGRLFKPNAVATLSGLPILGPVEFDATQSIQSHINGQPHQGWIVIPDSSAPDYGNGTGYLSGSLGIQGPPKLTVVIEGEPASIKDYSIY